MQRSASPSKTESLTPAEERLTARAAWLYYMDGMTQEEVAQRMGLSRIKINRLISQARRVGMVQISIKLPDLLYPEVEEALCRHFDLRDAVVTMEAEPGESLYRVLAQGTADWLTPPSWSSWCHSSALR